MLAVAARQTGYQAKGEWGKHPIDVPGALERRSEC